MNTNRHAGKKEKSGRPQSLLLNLLILACLFIFGFAAYKLYVIYSEYEKGTIEYSQIKEQYFSQAIPEKEELGWQPDHAGLLAENPDYIGWLDIPGTKISYPVVQGENNTIYLSQTFDKNGNSAGAIFADSRGTSDFLAPHTILYGHNMKNGSMFGELSAYLKEDFYAEHQEIILYKPGYVLRYRVYAVRETTVEDWAYQFFQAESPEFEKFVEKVGAPVGTQQILTLSTCTNREQEGRYIIQAALVSCES